MFHLMLEYILNKCHYVTHHFNAHFSLFIFLLMTLLRGWTKKLHSTSQSQACTEKNVKVTVWWSAMVWSTTAFWISGKPLHLRSVLSRSMRCTQNCSTRSWHWSTERAQFSATMPNFTLHNQHFKSWKNWATKFHLIHHIHLTSCQPTTISSSVSTTFCRENTSTMSRRQTMLSKNSSNPKAWIFMLQK